MENYGKIALLNKGNLLSGVSPGRRCPIHGQKPCKLLTCHLRHTQINANVQPGKYAATKVELARRCGISHRRLLSNWTRPGRPTDHSPGKARYDNRLTESGST